MQEEKIELESLPVELKAELESCHNFETLFKLVEGIKTAVYKTPVDLVNIEALSTTVEEAKIYADKIKKELTESHRNEKMISKESEGLA